MAIEYGEVVNRIYRCSTYGMRYYRREPRKTTSVKYMEIPIKDSFELPVFALHAFEEYIHKTPNMDVLVAPLYSMGAKPSYVTLTRYMKDVLLEGGGSECIELDIPGDPPLKYYGTHGAVFDENLKPVMICSWQIERKPSTSEERLYDYFLKRPLIRISPDCFQAQSNAMEKFIAKKFPMEILSTRSVTTFSISNTPIEQRHVYHIKIEIDESPFYLKQAEFPSVSVTDHSLLQIARDHIDEIKP